MTGVKWVRLDAGFPYNAKIITLTDRHHYRAVTVYVAALAYSGAQGTEGWIPTGALPFLHGRKTEAEQLVTVGLWHPCDGGWRIHNWHDYQPTNDTLDTREEDRKRRARAAANTRWHGTPDP